MPQGHQARAADELELMDMDEVAAVAAEPKAAAEKEAKQEETIAASIADY